MLSFVLNWVTSFGTGFGTLIGAWGANGLAQSMGSPGSRLVANWFGAQERGRAFGMYVLAAGMSSVLAYVTSLVVLDVWHLELALDFPAARVVDAVRWHRRLVRRTRSTERAGFSDEDAAGAAPGEPAVAEGTIRERYGAALSNGRLMLAAIAIGFQDTVRYWTADLGARLLPRCRCRQGHERGNGSAIALPVGMAIGAVTSGWISDRFCNGRRSGVIASFMALAGLAALAMYALPPGHWLGVPVLFSLDFSRTVRHSAFWALAPDLLGRARTGTAVGVMNFFAYAMAGLGEPFIGWMIQHNPLAGPLSAEAVAIVFPTRRRVRRVQRACGLADPPMNSARVQLFHGQGRPFELRTAALPDELGVGEVLVRSPSPPSAAPICTRSTAAAPRRRRACWGTKAVGQVVSGTRPGVYAGTTRDVDTRR